MHPRNRCARAAPAGKQIGTCRSRPIRPIFNERARNPYAILESALIRGALVVRQRSERGNSVITAFPRQLTGLRKFSEAELGVQAPRLSLSVRRVSAVDIGLGLRVRRGGTAADRS
jgi:hypothetical protein